MTEFKSIYFPPTIDEGLNTMYATSLQMQVLMSMSKSDRPFQEIPDDALEITRMALSDLVAAIQHEQFVRYA